jgi:hypothetical protein
MNERRAGDISRPLNVDFSVINQTEILTDTLIEISYLLVVNNF